MSQNTALLKQDDAGAIMERDKKTCARCKNSFPCTKEYFNLNNQQRDGLNPYCKGCSKLKGRQQYAQKPEAALSYRQRNADKVRVRESQYWQNNKEKKRAKDKRYFEKNREKNRIRCRLRYAANPEPFKHQLIEWAKAHPEYIKERARKRNLIRRGVPLDEVAKEYVSTILKDPCAYCGGEAEVIDHVIPVSKGGDSSFSNLAPSCSECNYKKSNKNLIYFLAIRSHHDSSIGTAKA